MDAASKGIFPNYIILKASPKETFENFFSCFSKVLKTKDVPFITILTAFNIHDGRWSYL
jgi:hypothetical protein